MTPQTTDIFLAPHYSKIRGLLVKAGYRLSTINAMLGSPDGPIPLFIKVARLATRNPNGRTAKQYLTYHAQALVELHRLPAEGLANDWAKMPLLDGIAAIACHDLQPESDGPLTFTDIESVPAAV